LNGIYRLLQKKAVDGSTGSATRGRWLYKRQDLARDRWAMIWFSGIAWNIGNTEGGKQHGAFILRELVSNPHLATKPWEERLGSSDDWRPSSSVTVTVCVGEESLEIE
jgi:hypothetical protein